MEMAQSQPRWLCPKQQQISFAIEFKQRKIHESEFLFATAHIGDRLQMQEQKRLA